MRARGYALPVVLLVLALLSVGLGTLFHFLEASARTTSSLLERRRVFYACDGIGRAATVLAQSYMRVAQPSTAGLIDAVCTDGGGGCCPSATGTVGACDGRHPPALTSNKTAFTAHPEGPGPTALQKIVPSGFKLKHFSIQSIADPCVTDADCPAGGACVAGGCRVTAPLPNGPFEGMNARQDTIAISLRAEHVATTGFACATEQTLTLGKIAMFQFFVFSESPVTDWHPGPRMFATGRLHANGNVCVGGADSGGLFLDRITASGDVLHFRDPACPYRELHNGWTKTFVANRNGADFDSNNNGIGDDPVATDFTAFTENARALAGAHWADYAFTTWAGHLLDRAHGVPALKLPIVGTPQTQTGTDAEGNPSAATRNGRNSRVLIDPVRTGIDGVDVRDQKFAQKADIRIINGIWYLRNVADPNQWPGIPIWSDHGGNYVASNDHDGDGNVDSTERGNNPDVDKNVGQADLLVDRGWSAVDMPRLFSYYGTRPDNGKHLIDLIGTQPEAVISYGTLVRRGDAHTATWRPGVRSLFQAGPRYSFCGDAPAGTASAGTPWRDTILDALAMPCAPTAFKKRDGVTNLSAADADEVTSAALIAATRSGFRDGHAQEHFGAASDEANILPINVDLAALQNALASTRKGELGYYFSNLCAGRGCMKARFNGILYISATYPAARSPDGRSSEDGYPDAQPGRLPAQGNVDDPDQPFRDDPGSLAKWVANTRLLSDGVGRQDRGEGCTGNADDDPTEACTGEEQAALPWMLCSANTTGRARAGDAFDDTGLFVRPACNVNTTSRPNAIRVINARNINIEVQAGAPDLPATAQLPNGLTIVSNLPVYVVGDVNIASDPENVMPTPVAPNDKTPATWWPVLVGGDVVHLLSNAWDDRRSRWGVRTGDQRYGSNNINNDGVQVNPESGTNALPRKAQETFYYMEILGGWGFSHNGFASGGIHNFPRFLEDWGGIRARIRGSLVIGHNKVYSRHRWHCCNANSYSPPNRDWGFDPTLEDLLKQPPGAPVYDVAAVKQWTRN